MFNAKYLLSIAILCILNAFETSACTGCIQLDLYTFDKLISKFDATLVKFDVAFPYGDQHDAYGQIAKDAQPHDNLLIAEVGIKDYGERDNEEIALRYDVKKEDYPVTKLFLKGKKQPITLTEKPLTNANIRKFLKVHSGIHLSLSGCISSLDKLALKYIEANANEKASLLKKADSIVSALKDQEAKTGKIYQLVMKRISEKGEDFVKSENDRLNKLLQGKLSEDKRKEILVKLNILLSFADLEESKPKDEL